MSIKKTFIIFVIIINIIVSVCMSTNASADETCMTGASPACTCLDGTNPPCCWDKTDPPCAPAYAPDEKDTFISAAPDALIVLDISGSMNKTPAGSSYALAHDTSCASSGSCWGLGCWGGFCSFSNIFANCQTDCSRYGIATRAIFSVMDNDNNGKIDSNDAKSLGIRLGYYRFRGCIDDDTAGNYDPFWGGCAKLIRGIGSAYPQIYCGISLDPLHPLDFKCTQGHWPSVIVEAVNTYHKVWGFGSSGSGGTVISSSLKEVKTYLDTLKSNISDTANFCREKYVILLTDGSDTYSCGGSGSDCQQHMYKLRRGSVAAAKALADAGYKLFVIGFAAGLPDYLKNTLNWMAYYGGTDNTMAANTGDPDAYNPASVTSCTNEADANTATATCYSGSSSSNQSKFKATSKDPGYLPLSGYAFFAENEAQLTTALKKALGTIAELTYSFTQPSIQAARTYDENFVYEASFETLSNKDPLWIGHLKRFQIIASDTAHDGEVSTTSDWDAGEILQNHATASSRNIFTVNTSGVKQDFSTTYLTKENLDVATDAERNAIISFIRGGDDVTGYIDYKGWKLGDIFHSSPLSIATPNANFYDKIDKSNCNNKNAFDIFRAGGFYGYGTISCATPYSDHYRTSANGKRMILVGANDGQLHAFRTSDGQESWSFIPPNLLPRLKAIAHSSHPTLLTHQYFVDGPLSAAEIWVGTDQTKKQVNEWQTLLVMSEGRGGNPTLWGSSSSCLCTSSDCDVNFSPYYASTSATKPYPYYCGYYALDVTDTSSPIFKWHLGGTSAMSDTAAKHLGQPWSKMFIGRVLKNGKETWAGFIGGGYSGTNCVGADETCDKRGKGFYVVDLNDGSILWSFTHANDGKMDYDLVAGPSAIDYDNDGFLDTAYVGDTGGNIWRFKFCLAKDSASSCAPYGTPAWTGSLLYENNTPIPAAGNLAIYTSVAIARGSVWVYVGTGNKTDPDGNSGTERFYAIKDDEITKTTPTPYHLSDLTSGTYTASSGKYGWYINLTGAGEKVLAEPLVFNGEVYFTTYTPPSISAPDDCDKNGDVKLYVRNYITGAGWSGSIGKGVPSGAFVSLNPNVNKANRVDIYVSTSKPKNPDNNITPENFTFLVNPGSIGIPVGVIVNPVPKTLLYWQDMRIQ